jgi:hypothetical protein
MTKTMTKTKVADPLLQAVVRVWHGRGFVVERDGYRLILTAAHCLPAFPKPHPASYLRERTYKALLGPLGAKRTVWAELLFADPIADIAVLGSPDNQELAEQAEAYEALVERATPLPIGDAPKQGSKRVEVAGGNSRPPLRQATALTAALCKSFDVPTPGRGDAYVLSLDGKRLKCTVTRWPMWLVVDDDERLVKSGMSGSPIILPDGHAIGLLSTGGQNPVLIECLPRRFSR